MAKHLIVGMGIAKTIIDIVLSTDNLVYGNDYRLTFLFLGYAIADAAATWMLL